MSDFYSGFAPLIENYLEIRSVMGYSKDHAKWLKFFDRFCSEHYPELDCLTKEVVRGWISHEVAVGRSALLSKATAIRMFAKYQGNDAYMLPTKAIPQKRAYSPYILTDAELSAFFDTVDALESRANPFLRETVSVLWRLLYTSGLRPREGRLIRCSDICFNTGEILITKAKRNKERIIVVSGEMLEMCKAYNVQRSAAAGGCEYFFVTFDGLPLKNTQLYHWFRRCWAEANPGIPPHLLPNLRQYDLRHRYASTILQKWLDDGHNLYAMLPYLRTYMGHEKFEDTAYYIHILPENLLKSPGVDWDRLDQLVPEVGVWKS